MTMEEDFVQTILVHGGTLRSSLSLGRGRKDNAAGVAVAATST
jgi:hypothetical protein